MKLNSNLGLSAAAGIFLSISAVVGGCSGRASILPNPDPTLRKTSTEFAVDAAKRFPYKAAAPQAGEAIGRAEVGYMIKRVDIVNNSADSWNNVEVWLNQNYVVYVPKMTPHILVELPFQMFYDDQGHYFPKDGSSSADSIVKKVEVLMDGKMYNVPLELPDH